MAELLPSSTSEKTPTEKLGLGLLIAVTTSHDPINPTGSNFEIQHTKSSPNAPDGQSDSPAVVLAAEVGEESAATDEEVELRNALERDLCQLTIEQAEIERARERLGGVDEEEGKDGGKVKLDDLLEGNDGKNAESVEDEHHNGWGYMENEGTVKLDNLHEERGIKIAGIVEDENENGWGYMENEGTVKLDNVHEEKDGKNAESVEYGIESGWGYMENEGAVKLDNVHEEKDGKNAESVEDENENGWGYMENVGGNEENEGNEEGKSQEAATKFGRYNQSNNNRRVNYPMRPDAEDCAFYMRFGTCKFGSHCKFNHPPRRNNQGVKERPNPSEENSERAGQTECKYYLTSGGCRYGKDCKFSHASDKNSKSLSLEFNFLGLPIRPGEKECPYYMRTGTCKYGSSCRFHHPEPTTVVGADSPSGYGNDGSIPSQFVSSSSISSWSSPRVFNDTSSFTPVMFSPTQGAPISDPEWNSYQAATYPTSERSLPTPPAFALNNLPTEINFPMQHHHGMVLEEYPERPSEQECSFFMKTGDCKFKSNCKFHHPKNRNSKARANSCTLNDKGLPLRPDQPICTHYHRYGICKYGPACKYDHPSSFGNLPTPFDQAAI